MSIKKDAKSSLLTRFRRWLFPAPSDRRKFRHSLPGLVASHWTGGTPQAFEIGDISLSGIFLLTEERWYPGTVILMTLRRTGTHGDNAGNSITVLTRVIRADSSGMGLAFVLSGFLDLPHGATHPESGAGRLSLEQFLRELNLPSEEPES